MCDNRPSWSRAVCIVGTALLLGGLVGCGPSLPKTYPVKGKLAVKGGTLRDRSTIMFQLTSDPMVVADGAIEKDGSFTMTTRMYGLSKPGAVEGEHHVTVTEGPPPGEALPIQMIYMVVKNKAKVLPADNDLTIELERIAPKGKGKS